MVKSDKRVYVSFPVEGISVMEQDKKRREYFLDAITIIRSSNESNSIDRIYYPQTEYLPSENNFLYEINPKWYTEMVDSYNSTLLLNSDYLYLGEGWENDKLCIRDYGTAKNFNIKILKNKFIDK